MKVRFKRLLTIGIAAAMIGAQPLPVSADDYDTQIQNADNAISDLQNQQSATNQSLTDVQNSINDMESDKQELLDQIDGYDQELVITMASISSMDDQIQQKEKELEQTEKDLADAEADQETQYNAMKKRIQYLYEKGGDNGWASVLIGSLSLSEGLDKVDDTKSLYEYDRNELTAYTETVTQVKNLKAQETAQKSSLEASKQELEGAKENLESLKADAQAQGQDLDALLADAQSKADQYYALIQEQNAQISELQSQKAAAENAKAEQEAAEKAAQEKAAQEAAAQQAAAQQAAASQTAVSGATDSTGSGSASSDASGATSSDTSSSDGTASSNTAVSDNTSSSDNGSSDNSSAAASDSGTSSGTSSNAGASSSASSSSGTSASTTTSGVTGQDVVNYALQFVGNPYVWGGTSLTNGCDCSGFVQAVYAHFGISLSRTTYTQANEGIAVSYSDMQPGDVINYGSHTSIYIGNNMIVHAADESLGIITQSNPAFEPIVTIRRFIY
ncbi:MAG: NlpC/P60 family protein [Eubacterium sp.]|nr:NlpC/P60 family protein [Eubacterium sp.]